MSHSLEQAIDSYVTNYLAQSQVAGLAIAVVRDGEGLYAKGFGMQNVATGQPVTPQTLFHLASICKTFVGTAIMQLKEAGKLYLDDPIVKHLPYFRVDDPRSDQLTIRHLLTHTSGLPHPDDEEYAYNRIHIPSGCIASNVLEMTRYGLAHLNQCALTGQRILSAESYAEM